MWQPKHFQVDPTQISPPEIGSGGGGRTPSPPPLYTALCSYIYAHFVHITMNSFTVLHAEQSKIQGDYNGRVNTK